MEPWQAALIGRIVGEIDAYSARRRTSLGRLVEDCRGLFDAADISDTPTRMAFESVWAPVSAQAELRTAAWSNPEWISKSDLNAALSELRDWASDVAGRTSP
jgi:hypothetical protein